MTTQEIILDTLRMADLSREYLARAEAAEAERYAFQSQVLAMKAIYEAAEVRCKRLEKALRLLQNYPRGPLTRFEIDRIIDDVLISNPIVFAEPQNKEEKHE